MPPQINMLSYLTRHVKGSPPQGLNLFVRPRVMRGIVACFQFRNLPPLTLCAFKPGHPAPRNAHFLARECAAFVAAHEVFPLVEIRRDGDIEKTHHHLFVGLLAPADLPVGIGVMWVLG